jgi:predicted nicotinamide N-methyase
MAVQLPTRSPALRSNLICGVPNNSVADIGLEEYRLRVGEREWSVLHTGALISFGDEQQFLSEPKDSRLPYGLALWPASIALAHDLAERAGELRGARLLELGAGTGLPGIVASAFGARVTQSDRHENALAICEQNGQRNGALGIEYRVADWVHWNDPTQYDFIIGADILYAEGTQAHLRRLFENNLSRGGRILLSDPFRLSSIRFLETLDGHGWSLTMTKWSLGEADDARAIGVFELRRVGS